MHCKHKSMVYCEGVGGDETDSIEATAAQSPQHQQTSSTQEENDEEEQSWQSALYHHELSLENRTAAPISSQPSNAPKGPDIPRPKYYTDSMTSSCISTLDQEPPTWVGEDQMFNSKWACCQAKYSWNPNCLGVGFQEVTYSPSSMPSVSALPTMTPTVSPSGLPTVSPSSVPSMAPSRTPSVMPSSMPTVKASEIPSSMPSSPAPTRSPLARGETSRPTMYDVTQMLDVLDAVGSSGSGLINPVYGYNTGVLPPRPLKVDVPASSSSSSLMSELILQVVQDATISQQRPDANFGSHAALAVDAGYQGSNEKFDSILKFDLSLIDAFEDVDSVTLQLYSMANCEGSALYTTYMSSWDQEKVTWDSGPSRIIERVGLMGLVTAQKWYDVDVTSALTANRHYTIGSDRSITLRIDTEKNGRCMYAAMDGSEGNGARLVVKYGSQSDTEMVLKSKLDPVPVYSKTRDFSILRATDDATLDLNDGMGQYGLTPTLNVAFNLDTRHVQDFIVRFDLSQLRLLPTKAIFTLFAEHDCSNSGTILVVADDSSDWTEEEVSYETAPPFIGQPEVERDLTTDIGSFGPVTAGKWYGADVVDSLKGAIRARRSSLTFRMTTSVNANPCQYSSIQSGRAPKLMVEF